MTTGNKFSMVSPAVWWSKRFRALGSSDAKLLYFYFLSSERQNSAGCFPAREGHVVADLGWSADAYRMHRKSLIDAELIAYDDDTETVYVLRWFKHCRPMNDKHALGTRRVIEAIESDTIREMVERDFTEADDARKSPKGNVEPFPRHSNSLLNSRMVAGGSNGQR
jgi:hypothetical protein